MHERAHRASREKRKKVWVWGRVWGRVGGGGFYVPL